MPSIDIIDTFRKIEITQSGPADASIERVRQLQDLLTEFRAATAVAWLDVKSAPGPDPDLWSYEFEHEDGRQWSQLLRTDPLPAKVTFDTHGDEWAISEFASQRALRDLVIEFLIAGATKIKVDWLAP